MAGTLFFVFFFSAPQMEEHLCSSSAWETLTAHLTGFWRHCGLTVQGAPLVRTVLAGLWPTLNMCGSSRLVTCWFSPPWASYLILTPLLPFSWTMLTRLSGYIKWVVLGSSNVVQWVKLPVEAMTSCPIRVEIWVLVDRLLLGGTGSLAEFGPCSYLSLREECEEETEMVVQ